MHCLFSPTRIRNGFTLIEMMMYMGLVSIFLLVLTDLLVSTFDVRSESTSSFAVAVDGEYIHKRLEYDLRRSEDIVVPSSVGGANSTATLIIGGNEHVYAVVQGNLLLTTQSKSYQLNSDGTRIDNFMVTRIGNDTSTDTLRFSFTLSSRTQLRNQAGESKSIVFTIAGR